MLEAKNIQQIIDKLQVESDRACAVLGVAMLDALLENLIRKAMLFNTPEQLFKQLFGGTGPLATLSAKIDLAYTLGFIDTQEHGDLHKLRRIRNDFAHVVTHDLSFSTTHVIDRVHALAIPKLFVGHQILAGSNDTIRFRFQLCIGTLAFSLSHLRISKITHATEPIKMRT